MTGLTLLRQAYGLLGDAERRSDAEQDEQGLMAVNQIYSELWSREHTTDFMPLHHLRQPLLLTYRCLPAMAYGTAMLLCLNREEGAKYTRFQTLYDRAAAHTGGPYGKRRDVLFGVYEP